MIFVMFMSLSILDVCGGPAVIRAGPGQVPAEGATVFAHSILHLVEQGTLELLLEVVAHEDIEERVQKAVGRRNNGAHPQSHGEDLHIEMVGGQLQQNEDVVWKPADEESGDEGRHDLEGFGRFGHLVLCEFVDNDSVAEDDDQEGHHEPSKEPAPRNVLVAVSIRVVIVDASHLP